jgi:beta-phosphoglucomutase-like phosphatase (HAD superfamily)
VGLGFAPEHCLVVEDALAGIASGKNAGARVIAFTTTASITDLVAAKPDWILKDCSAIRLEALEPELKLALEEITVNAR